MSWMAGSLAPVVFLRRTAPCRNRCGSILKRGVGRRVGLFRRRRHEPSTLLVYYFGYLANPRRVPHCITRRGVNERWCVRCLCARSNGALYEKTSTDGGGTWGAWASLGGQLASGTGPAACSRGSGRLDVFVQGTDGALWHKWWNGAKWSGWESLGGKLTSSPTAASRSSGTIDVFVRGTDNGLWKKTYSGGWSGWTSVSG